MQASRLGVFILISGLVCFLCLSSVLAQTGGPDIRFPETRHNFGHVSQGDKLTHTFVIQNTGDAPLKLIKAKGS